MQQLAEENRALNPAREHPHAQESAQVTPITGEVAQSGQSLLLDAMELEALALNMDASLRVHARHQFFGWTQGLLQNLIPHELLICAMRKGDGAPFLVDCFSMSPAEPNLFSELFREDTSLVPYLIETWELNHCEPVVVDIAGEKLSSSSALARELNRLGGSQLIVHGTTDTSGKLASLFVFACRADAVGPKQRRLVELLVPFLYVAWVHSKMTRNPDTSAADAHPEGRDLLTVREQEILRWIYLGKTNIEIGMILGISPLTVKNHVQKILRRLNVQNRTQAVGKALVLRILTS